MSHVSECAAGRFRRHSGPSSWNGSRCTDEWRGNAHAEALPPLNHNIKKRGETRAKHKRRKATTPETEKGPEQQPGKDQARKRKTKTNIGG